MKYSIFHTSRAGSTLLACYLSRSLPTLTEPKWSHDIIEKDTIEDKLKLVKDNHKDGMLVKYSSLCCDIAPHIEGKKVFIFRNILDHLIKVEGDKEEGHLYLKRLGNILECTNTMWIPYNNFIEQKQKTVERVCNFFEIEYKPVEIGFHVKNQGFNHRDEPIEI